jgi:hypothetical protein
MGTGPNDPETSGDVHAGCIVAAGNAAATGRAVERRVLGRQDRLTNPGHSLQTYGTLDLPSATSPVPPAPRLIPEPRP